MYFVKFSFKLKLVILNDNIGTFTTINIDIVTIKIIKLFILSINSWVRVFSEVNKIKHTDAIRMALAGVGKPWK